MSRAEVFNTLEDMGVARAVVQFAGGSDEGDTGQTTFHMVGGEILAAPETSEPQNSEFHTALDEPVYEQYGGFDGGFYVEGTITWVVSERRVVMRGSMEEMRPFEDTVI